MLADAARNEEQLDPQGRPRPLHRNLDDEFVRVDGHDVYKTPSANLAVAANELARLEQMPAVTMVTAMLKSVHCQVNEILQDQRPSYSTSSICRSAALRSNRCPSRSRFTNQQRDVGQPLQGELGGTASTTLANMAKKSTKMSGHTSTISRTSDVISMGTVSLAMKKKYAGVKSTNKNSAIRMLPSSHSMSATL